MIPDKIVIQFLIVLVVDLSLNLNILNISHYKNIARMYSFAWLQLYISFEF